MPRPDIPDWVCPTAVVTDRRSARRVIWSVEASPHLDGIEVRLGTSDGTAGPVLSLEDFLAHWQLIGWQSPERPVRAPQGIPPWMRRGALIRHSGGDTSEHLTFIFGRIAHEASTGRRVVHLHHVESGLRSPPVILDFEVAAQTFTLLTLPEDNPVLMSEVTQGVNTLISALGAVAAGLGSTVTAFIRDLQNADEPLPEWLIVGALLADSELADMPTVVQEVLPPSDGVPGLARLTGGSPPEPMVLTSTQVARRFRDSGVEAFEDELDGRRELPEIHCKLLPVVAKLRRDAPIHAEHVGFEPTIYDRLIADDILDGKT